MVEAEESQPTDEDYCAQEQNRMWLRTHASRALRLEAKIQDLKMRDPTARTVGVSQYYQTRVNKAGSIVCEEMSRGTTCTLMFLSSSSAFANASSSATCAAEKYL
jgi:hypothetical protein